MIDPGHWLQVSAAALQASSAGAAAYVDDLNRMRAALGAAPLGFPWWGASLSGVSLLCCVAGLTAGHVYLNRRTRRIRALASAAPAFPLEA